jgi:putative membrane protein insertion efficiency factor
VSPVARVTVLLLRAYQYVLSPVFGALGATCRFHPTCSAYAIVSVEKYGVLRGLFRASRRLLRCHPLHPGGFDPP